MIYRAIEMERVWSLPMDIAQVDLKNAFDAMFRSHIASLLSRKDVCWQFVAALCSWWKAISLEVRVGHAVTEQPIIVDRGVLQGAPESPFVFVMVIDEILGGLCRSGELQDTDGSARLE